MMTSVTRKWCEAKKLLRDKSGASFIFVLGIMLALLAISVSALVAAGANVNAAVNQTSFSELMLITDSIQKNILYGLQNAPDSDTSMSSQLVMKILNAHDPDTDDYTSNEWLDEFELAMDTGSELDLSEYNYTVKITLSFPEQYVGIDLPVWMVPAEYATDPETGLSVEMSPAYPRIEKKATVEAEMLVTLELSLNNEPVMTTLTCYEFTGGSLSDDRDIINKWTEGTAIYDMKFEAGGYGKWEMIKHERVETYESVET